MPRLARLLAALLERLEELMIATALTAMVVTITAQVLARYVFNVPLAWTEELARYLFIWLVFLGASQAMRRGEHIAIGLFVEMLPVPVRLAAGVLINTMVAAFLAVLVVMAWRVVGVVAPLKSIALKVTMAVVYLPLVVGGAAMFVRTLINIGRILRHGPARISANSL